MFATISISSTSWLSTSMGVDLSDAVLGRDGRSALVWIIPAQREPRNAVYDTCWLTEKGLSVPRQHLDWVSCVPHCARAACARCRPTHGSCCRCRPHPSRRSGLAAWAQAMGPPSHPDPQDRPRSTPPSASLAAACTTSRVSV